MSGLILLSIFAIPIFVSLFALGIVLSYLRESEPQMLKNKSFNLTPLHINTNLLHIWHFGVTHSQHAGTQQHKSNFWPF